MQDLYDQLPVGRENAIKITDIAFIWGTTTRDARRKIEHMWYSGMPVCNLFDGYFRPRTVDELRQYLNIVASYKRKLMKKEYRVKCAIDDFGQVSFKA